jgi:thioesterase domain-containing protein
MVKAGSLQRYLHERIPISKAMGVEVLEATVDGVKLAAPLSPNINHRETVFGGSASAVAILSAWSLLYLRLKYENIDSRIVIQKNTMTYERPITDRFTASSIYCDATVWLKFIATLKRKNRARVKICSVLHCNGRKVGELEGDFVALDSITA